MVTFVSAYKNYIWKEKVKLNILGYNQALFFRAKTNNVSYAKPSFAYFSFPFEAFFARSMLS